MEENPLREFSHPAQNVTAAGGADFFDGLCSHQNWLQIFQWLTHIHNGMEGVCGLFFLNLDFTNLGKQQSKNKYCAAQPKLFI